MSAVANRSQVLASRPLLDFLVTRAVKEQEGGLGGGEGGRGLGGGEGEGRQAPSRKRFPWAPSRAPGGQAEGSVRRGLLGILGSKLRLREGLQEGWTKRIPEQLIPCLDAMSERGTDPSAMLVISCISLGGS